MDIFEINNTFAERFKAKRKEKGYTQQTFANAIGLSDYKTIGAWEKGKIPQQTEQLIMTAELLECDIDYLLGFQKEPTKELTDVCEATGLSAEAVKRLQVNKALSAFIDYLLCSDDAEQIDALLYESYFDCLTVSSFEKSPDYKEYKRIIRDKNHPKHWEISKQSSRSKGISSRVESVLGADVLLILDINELPDNVKGLPKDYKELLKYDFYRNAENSEKNLRYTKYDISEKLNTIISRFLRKRRRFI